MPEIMFVGVGRMGRPYLDAARRLGCRVSAVESFARIDAVADELDAVHVCRGELDELWVEAASAAVHTQPPAGVVAFSEPQVLAAALLQDTLGLAGPSLHAAVLSRNKALQRGRFAAHGIRQPAYLVTDDLGAAAEWATARLPVVVKPLSSAGSEGVELVADAQAYAHVAARRAAEKPLLVENAVEGPEYSWEAVVCDGRVWFSNLTQKETTGPPNFVEVSHRTGIRLDGPSAGQVDELTSDVLSALQMRSGIVHLEFRLAEAGPTLMEVAVRTPGDFLMELLNLTYEIDWFEMVVRLALGWPLPPPPASVVRYGASYLPIAEPGVVTRVRGLAQIQAHPCVFRAELSVREGETVVPARSSAHRAGHVLLAAETQEALEESLDFVRNTLEICTEAA